MSNECMQQATGIRWSAQFQLHVSQGFCVAKFATINCKTLSSNTSFEYVSIENLAFIRKHQECNFRKSTTAELK